MSKIGRAAAVGALCAGGAALGFLAERRLVRGRFAPPVVPADVPLGSIAGERTTVAGPNGLPINVERYGPADAPPVVLVHGWVCTSRVWHEQVLRLRDRYQVITFDLPGHGKTPAPADGQYSLHLLAETLVAVLAQAVPSTSVAPVVAGHSLGGMTVLHAARRGLIGPADPRSGTVDRTTHSPIPVAGVALISTTSSAASERLTLEASIRGAARVERRVRRLIPVLREPRIVGITERLTSATSDLSYLLARWTSVGPNADPQVVAFTQQMTIDSGADVILGLLQSVLNVDDDAGLDALAAIPTVITVGTHDRLTPLDLSLRMAERSRAALVELPDVGHMSVLEAPDEVAAVIARLLAGQVAAAAS